MAFVTPPPFFLAYLPAAAQRRGCLEPSVSLSALLPSVAALTEPANLVGLIALGSSITWPQLRHRKAILAVQVAGSLLFGLHYLLLGASTAAAMCVMGALQGIALVVLIERRHRVAVVGATLAIGTVVSALTWNGLPSLLSQSGQAMSAFGRLQLDTQKLRLWFLASTFFWCTHNLMVGSVFGLCSDMLALTSLLLGLWRNRSRAPAAKLSSAAA